MRKLSFTVVFSLVIFNTVCFSDSSVAIASTNCDGNETVKLAEKPIFCIPKEDVTRKRTDIITDNLEIVASDPDYDLNTIEVILNSQESPPLPNQIRIDNPGSSSEPKIIITIRDEDTFSDGKPLNTFERSTLKELITLELQNRRKDLILAQLEQLDIPISETSTNKPSKYSGDWWNTWLDAITKVITALLLVVAIVILCQNRKNINQIINKATSDQITSQDLLNHSTSIKDAIDSVKEGLSKVQQENGQSDKLALFTLGSTTINLKTVVDQNGNLKVAPASLLEASSGFSNQKTQDLTLVFNPLKVFSGTSCTLNITYKEQSTFPPFKRQTISVIKVTEADFVDVKDRTYLWVNRKIEAEELANKVLAIKIKAEELAEAKELANHILNESDKSRKLAKAKKLANKVLAIEIKAEELAEAKRLAENINSITEQDKYEQRWIDATDIISISYNYDVPKKTTPEQESELIKLTKKVNTLEGKLNKLTENKLIKCLTGNQE